MREVQALYGERTISDSQRLMGKCLQMPVTGMEYGDSHVEWLLLVYRGLRLLQRVQPFGI